MSFVVTPPLLGFIVVTRAMIGIGVGLLAADRLTREQRKAVGATLIAIGAASTLPAAIGLIRSRRRTPEAVMAPGIA
jgi:hypothetical protein